MNFSLNIVTKFMECMIFQYEYYDDNEVIEVKDWNITEDCLCKLAHIYAKSVTIYKNKI